MTHAEAKDLLLEHAYGELPAHVASEVAEHLTGCDECRLEQVAIASLRNSFAPLAPLEEPGEGFDARILAAARAEAQLTHDGNIGEVVEVTASEAPSGIEAVSIDAHARPTSSPAAPPRPKWMKAAIAAASVAAVAALALVVGMPAAPKTPQPQETYQIHVAPQAAPDIAHPADESARESAAQLAVERGQEAQGTSNATRNEAPPPAAQQASKVATNNGAERAATPAAAAAQQTAPSAGARAPSSAGQAAPSAVAQAAPSAGQPAPSAAAQAAPSAQPVAPRPPPTRDRRLANAKPAEDERSAAAKPQSNVPTALPATREPAANAAARSDAEAGSEAVAPAELERRAGAARRSGNYPLAATLYRKAAQGRTDDPSSAAWDLAHAVECFSAAGSFDDARSARDALKQRYPAESGAFSAARRALREVDPGE
ncbi:MAG TPA: hypothetical protein VGH20_08275 [Myxococcales bacterium]|jgi:hypothetical protein